LFWNRLFGTTGPVEIDFGHDSNPARTGQEITHADGKVGIYTAALRSRGPADEPGEVRMRIVIDPADLASTQGRDEASQYPMNPDAR
jgi:hypothetical protein